jgi:hypothetical protein
MSETPTATNPFTAASATGFWCRRRTLQWGLHATGWWHHNNLSKSKAMQMIQNKCKDSPSFQSLHIYLYVCTYIYMYVYVYTQSHVYIEQERKGEKETNLIAPPKMANGIGKMMFQAKPLGFWSFVSNTLVLSVCHPQTLTWLEWPSPRSKKLDFVSWTR